MKLQRNAAAFLPSISQIFQIGGELLLAPNQEILGGQARFRVLNPWDSQNIVSNRRVQVKFAFSSFKKTYHFRHKIYQFWKSGCKFSENMIDRWYKERNIKSRFQKCKYIPFLWLKTCNTKVIKYSGYANKLMKLSKPCKWKIFIGNFMWNF